MWSKDTQSEIQMVKEISKRANSNNCLHWWGEKFASLNKMLPVHHDCNPNDQEISHKLKIPTAFLYFQEARFLSRNKKLQVNPDFDNVNNRKTAKERKPYQTESTQYCAII